MSKHTMTRTPELVRDELTSFIAGTGLWHFDDSMDDMIDAQTGGLSFSAWELAIGDALLDEAFAVLGEDEVWAIGMAEYERHDVAPNR